MLLMLIVRVIDRMVGATLALSTPDARALRLTVLMLMLTVALLGVLMLMLTAAWTGGAP
jgi:hypothetical protein